MNELFSLLASSLRISTPYAAGALGATVSERGGIVNIAIEGMMLSAAFAFVTGSYFAETVCFSEAVQQQGWIAPACGFIMALLAAGALGLLHAFTTVICKADHIISGFAINLLALGGTNFLLVRFFDSASNSPQCKTIPGLFPPPESGTVDYWGQVAHPIMIFLLLVFVAVHLLFYKFRFGFRLRSVGENPTAADSMGVNVTRYRMAGTVLGGLIAAVGGIWLANDTGQFTSNMTAGRGYISLAAMIVGRWLPFGALAACLIFGFAEAARTFLQLSSWSWAASIPDQFLAAAPQPVPLLAPGSDCSHYQHSEDYAASHYAFHAGRSMKPHHRPPFARVPKRISVY